MSARAAVWLAWGIWALSLVLTVVGGLLLAFSVSTPATDTWGFRGFNGVLALAFSTVGALIASRRRQNPIGWAFCAIGLVSAIMATAEEYAIFGTLARPGSLPWPEVLAWLNSWLWVVTVCLIGIFLFLLFPDGRLPSARWRPLVWVGIVAPSLAIVGLALTPGPLNNVSFLDNPFGIEAGGQVLPMLTNIAMMVSVGTIVVSAASLVLRLRRAQGEQRQQLKWFVSAAGLVAVTFSVIAIITMTFPRTTADKVGQIFFMASIVFVPIATGVAILRHRLYDIDLLINRTLVYGGLTATLALVYWGSVVLLQQVLRPFTQGSDLAIVGSTLVVAALFQPARSHIQAAVDRRFYRQRYDAARTLEVFGSRLREQVELESLKAELLAVTHRTVQPSHVSVWLRNPEQRAM